MKQEKQAAMQIVGIEVRTINAPGKAEQDIPKLWHRFMEEKPGEQLTNKLSEEIYCVYCDYEGDHLQPYTTLIGYKVEANAEIPEGMRALSIPESSYAVYRAEGDLTGTAVIDAWHRIWQDDTNRTYQADFEVYGEEAMDPTNGKINIFVGVQ